MDGDVPPGFPGSAAPTDDMPPGFTAKMGPGASLTPGAGGAAAAAAAAAGGPPPGISAPAAGNGAAKLSESLSAHLKQSAKVQDDDDVDDPDLAIRLGADAGLREHTGGEITTVVAHAADSNIYKSAAAFEDIITDQHLLRAIYDEMKFERPSKIQASTLPMILRKSEQGVYRDLIAQAHNGSGKTTCFVLAMLSRIDPTRQCPQAVCMCTTRELVAQNLAVLRRMAKYTGISSTSTAEDGMEAKNRKITEQVVIGTHGRMKNWVSYRQLEIENVVILVFDEADEMLKADAFADDTVRMIKTIRKKNPSVQLLLFSATYNDKVKAFAMRIAPSANQVFVPKEELSLDVISQYNVLCPSPLEKVKVLKDMIFPNCEKLGQTIIFVRMRDTSRQLHKQLEEMGFKITSIQGDMDHASRDRVVNEFRRGETKILIATDVLARGFDVSQVTLVVNFDIPMERDGRTPNFETYLHRIGRSGRFGRKGAAFNLMAGAADQMAMQSIADYFQHPIPEVPWNNEDEFITVLNKAGLTDQ